MATQFSMAQWRYNVFLSFRGEDTRYTFTNDLYTALVKKGILTFRDEERLERGSEISSALLRAIEDSLFSLVILSTNYASSTWCLDELAKIVQCIKEKQHTAFPVFYKVDPLEVREQHKGPFKEAFDRYEEQKREKVQRWRSALREIADLPGWLVKDGNEIELIPEIVKEMSNRFDQLLLMAQWNWKYDVFLSFRGEDAGKNFIDDLYFALAEKDISTFRKDERHVRGKDISALEHLRTIKESMFSIVILSKNYASSICCLDELAEIFECMKQKPHLVFPVFYNVDPSEVRKQHTGDFKKAFDIHEEENKEKVREWRSALKGVANLAGWHLKDIRVESQWIKKLVEEISKRLDELFSSISPDLVGIKPRVQKLMNDYLQGGLNEVRFVGICGMGGIGKTTVAKAVYEIFSNKCDDRCFLANVKDVSQRKGVESLQEKLLSKILKVSDFNVCGVNEGINLIREQLGRRKVFLVLDDVNELDQLKALAGEHSWFGYGSIIIITTREEHLLISHGVKNNHIYKVGGLDDEEALKLLHLKAFKHTKPTDDHFELSKQIISYAQGLPLAHEVLGSSLCDRSVKEWESALDKLQKYPNKRILEVLRVSYDGLDEINKKIFLDIACFFNGKNEYRVKELLKYRFDLDVEIVIRELKEKSLINILGNELWIHDLLQEMGWEIVRGQYPDDPDKWTRLWLHKDICHVLKKENMGTCAVEGIMLGKPEKDITNLKSKAFSNISNLKLLKISNLHFSEQLEYLSNELRYLKWPGYPLKSLPSSLHPENLAELSMCNSHIEYLWTGIKSLQKLKTIKLNHSCKLIRTPDFTQVPNLERLHLEGCISLLEVHKSVGFLRKLIVLNLQNCESLVTFPSNICGLTSLKILNLRGCSKIYELPPNLGEAVSLEELDISGAAVRQVPSSIERLTNLKTFSLHGCKVKPPETWSHFLQSFWMPKGYTSMCLALPPLAGLSSLRKLDLGDCNLWEGAIPSDIGSLSMLEELNLSRNKFVTIPDSLKQLSELKILCLENCEYLNSLPQLPPNIVFVGAEGCHSLETFPSTLLDLCNSREIALQFFNCFKLAENDERKNNLVEILLKRWFQELSDDCLQFYIRLPGSEIPRWFNHCTRGNSMEIELPSNWANEKFLGFAMCTVFALPATYTSEVPLNICCTLQISKVYTYHVRFVIPSFTRIESDHLCLGFLSKHKMKIGRGRFFKFPGRHIYMRVKIYDECKSWNTFVKLCGIRLVYQQDMENFGAPCNVEELQVAEDSIVEEKLPSFQSWNVISMPYELSHSSIRKVYEGFSPPDELVPPRPLVEQGTLEVEDDIESTGSNPIEEEDSQLILNYW